MINSINKVFVINLKEREDRRESMMVKLSKMGFPKEKIEFVEATTKSGDSWITSLKEIGIHITSTNEFITPDTFDFNDETFREYLE